MQTAVTSVKYGGLAVLALAGLALPFTPLELHAPASSVTLGGVLAAIVSVMWAYDGWADLASVAAETRDPQRTLPRALVFGTLAVGAIYLLPRISATRALLWIRRSSRRPATTWRCQPCGSHRPRSARSARARSHRSSSWSCVGGAMASMMTNSRALIPMATDGTFVRVLGRVDPTTGTPRIAVMVTGVLGALYACSRRASRSLTEGFVVGYFPFYALAIVALFVLRKREPALPRPFRVPLVMPIVFLAGAALVLGGAVLDGVVAACSSRSPCSASVSC